MSDNRRHCAECVFWAARGDRGGLSSGQCRALLASAAEPGQTFWTQASFVCDQWCQRPHPAAAE